MDLCVGLIWCRLFCSGASSRAVRSDGLESAKAVSQLPSLPVCPAARGSVPPAVRRGAFVVQPELQVEVEVEPAPRSPFRLSAHCCHGWLLFSLMLLTAQPLCALLLPVCVKLKVSVWMARQLFSLFWCSRGRGPINPEGMLSPGRRKGHSPRGEPSGEKLPH